MTTTATPNSVRLADLPAIGAALNDGNYAGAITQPDGALTAVVLLPGAGEDLTWRKAQTWAKKQGGVLPTRPVAALLYAHLKAPLRPRWHWTSEEHDASYAWSCSFFLGHQSYDHKSLEACAVAVRLIPVTA